MSHNIKEITRDLGSHAWWKLRFPMQFRFNEATPNHGHWPHTDNRLCPHQFAEWLTEQILPWQNGGQPQTLAQRPMQRDPTVHCQAVVKFCFVPDNSLKFCLFAPVLWQKLNSVMQWKLSESGSHKCSCNRLHSLQLDLDLLSESLMLLLSHAMHVFQNDELNKADPDWRQFCILVKLHPVKKERLWDQSQRSELRESIALSSLQILEISFLLGFFSCWISSTWWVLSINQQAHLHLEIKLPSFRKQSFIQTPGAAKLRFCIQRWDCVDFFGVVWVRDIHSLPFSPEIRKGLWFKYLPNHQTFWTGPPNNLHRIRMLFVQRKACQIFSDLRIQTFVLCDTEKTCTNGAQTTWRMRTENREIKIPLSFSDSIIYSLSKREILTGVAAKVHHPAIGAVKVHFHCLNSGQKNLSWYQWYSYHSFA